MESIPLITSFLDPRNLLTLAFYSFLIILSTSLVRKRVTHLGRLDSRNRKTSGSSSLTPSDCASCAWTSSFLQNNKSKKMHCKEQKSHLSNNRNQWNINDSSVNINNNNTNVSNNNNTIVCTCPSRDLLWFKSHSSSKLFVDREEHEVSIAASSSEDVSLLSLLLLIIPFIPVTNIFFYVGFVVAGEST